MELNETPPDSPRYRWPWFALAAVILFVLLAVLWMSREARRTRDQRYYPTPTSSPTNLPAKN